MAEKILTFESAARKIEARKEETDSPMTDGQQNNKKEYAQIFSRAQAVLYFFRLVFLIALISSAAEHNLIVAVISATALILLMIPKFDCLSSDIWEFLQEENEEDE